MACPLLRPANTDHRIKEILGVQSAFPERSVCLLADLRMAGLFYRDPNGLPEVYSWNDVSNKLSSIM
jgi:hypothetical protein